MTMMKTKPLPKMMPPQRKPKKPALRLSPTAWAKLLYLRDLGDTEVGGFGISAADDLLHVENIELVRQRCTVASVSFDDNAVADYFDRHIDAGRKPEQFARIWVHTHPGSCAHPSTTDEETFSRVFGRTDWAVMFILAQGGQAYARMQFSVGPSGSFMLPVEVDYRCPFLGSDHAAWQKEYLTNVEVEKNFPLATNRPRIDSLADEFDLGFWDDFFPDELIESSSLMHERSFFDGHR